MEQGRVLLLDDDREILEICSEILTVQGFETSLFEDPQESIQALVAGQQTDVIITDFRMPAMNGLQFLEQVTRHHIRKPVIMFTGVADKELAIKALNAGCYALLEKPVRNQELVHYTEQAMISSRWENISTRLLHECRDLIGLLRNLSTVYETRFTQAENIIYHHKAGVQPKPAEIQGYLKNVAQGVSIETEIQQANQLVEALSREHAALQDRESRSSTGSF
ncbi:MAG TPA: response regulator [Oligoflexus sp.]|uniref:response regulator n=1 Tax=Oligoflexus sp. TaxID=1971216 RepID=UPI002D52E663|nr:response regulator [Oligoflexus sp.]HYX34471.1 response regulator [Oligoflexus sp.]